MREDIRWLLKGIPTAREDSEKMAELQRRNNPTS